MCIRKSTCRRRLFFKKRLVCEAKTEYLAEFQLPFGCFPLSCKLPRHQRNVNRIKTSCLRTPHPVLDSNNSCPVFCSDGYEALLFEGKRRDSFRCNLGRLTETPMCVKKACRRLPDICGFCLSDGKQIFMNVSLCSDRCFDTNDECLLKRSETGDFRNSEVHYGSMNSDVFLDFVKKEDLDWFVEMSIVLY